MVNGWGMWIVNYKDTNLVYNNSHVLDMLTMDIA